MTVLDTATVDGSSTGDSPAATPSRNGPARRQIMFGAGGAAAAFVLLPAWSRPP